MDSRHQQVKSYTFADLKRNSAEFALKRIEDIYKASEGMVDSPHRHEYYSVIFIEKAKGKHLVDFAEYELEDATLYFIQPGQMHQLSFTEEPSGWMVVFTPEFLLHNSIPCQLIDDIYLFNNYGQSPPLRINERDVAVYRGLIEQMWQYSTSLTKYTNDAVGALVKVLLIQSNNHCSLKKEGNPQLQEVGNQLLRGFKQLVEEHYATKHMVADYADMLAITADYLNKTVKSLTGKSAKEHIQSRLITEAKRRLLFSEVSNKELSYELGFDEAAHFNNFFKKNAGVTPSEFRISARQS
jgi:AraC-like DNA-binding protein